MRLTFFMKVRVKITLGSLVVFLCGLYFPKEKEMEEFKQARLKAHAI